MPSSSGMRPGTGDGTDKGASAMRTGAWRSHLSAERILLQRGDKVLVHKPTYIGFTNSLINNGYNIVLAISRRMRTVVWRMDFEDMEEAQDPEDPRSHLLLTSTTPRKSMGEVGDR